MYTQCHFNKNISINQTNIQEIYFFLNLELFPQNIVFRVMSAAGSTTQY